MHSVRKSCCRVSSLVLAADVSKEIHYGLD
jgi:hypothetical protein